MKQADKKNVVIVGGGLPGLFSALLMSDRYPDVQVHLIERDKKLGGLYNSFQDSQAGRFDHGMHLIYESGVEEVDRHIREVMDQEDWITLTGNQKDIAGVFFNGELHEDSPYVDIRSLPETVQRECVADLFLHLNERVLRAQDCASAHEFFLNRFGPSVTNLVIEPVLEKLWKMPGSKLDPMVTRVVLMDRVRLYDSEAMSDLMTSELIRSRVAFPLQMELPLRYRSSQRGLYPRRFGMFHVIDAMEKKLVARGVNIHTEADVGKVEIADGAVKALHVKSPAAEVVIDNIWLLHWSIPVFGLAPRLGLQSPLGKIDAPHTQVHVYFHLRRRPKMGDLYYFYCFDPGFHTYRITSYFNYCPDALRPDGTYPICVELHFDATAQMDTLDLAGLATKELMQMGVIENPADITFSKAELSKTGFPVLTLNNSRMMGQLRALVEHQGITNLITAGQAPERGIFFLHDVLEHSYNAIVKFGDRQQ